MGATVSVHRDASAADGDAEAQAEIARDAVLRKVPSLLLIELCAAEGVEVAAARGPAVEAALATGGGADPACDSGARWRCKKSWRCVCRRSASPRRASGEHRPTGNYS